MENKLMSHLYDIHKSAIAKRDVNL